MAGTARPEIAFSDLMAAVGEVLLRWGYLELEMLKKLEASRELPSGRTGPLQQWRVASARSSSAASAWTAEIERAGQIRNLLAHGLVGGNARPEAGDPHVVCRDLYGSYHHISYAHLVATAQTLDLLRLRLAREPDDLLRNSSGV